MLAPEPITLRGSPGSPYTRKMLALLRYRHIAYKLLIGGRQGADAELPKPKVALLPTFYLPNDKGEIEAVVDSTPLIRRFETQFSGRAAIPGHPTLAFLDYLLEDYADEWLTKAMFHYRWHYEEDAAFAGDILPRWTVHPQTETALQPVQKMIRERQTERLYVVGSSDVTAPVIEDAYLRYIGLLADHLEKHAFLLGERPAASDFAAYGQLTQLTKVDPTPTAATKKRAPRIYAWVDVVDDLSGLDPEEGDWLAPDALPDTLKEIFTEMGRTYVPVMLANAHAVQTGEDEVRTEVEGRLWTQKPFPYQARCVVWIREAYQALPEANRDQVNAFLEGTGCEALLA